MLRAYGVTDKGRVRATNEDCFGLDLGLGLCVIADGMGGHNAGEIAASLAVETVVTCVRTATIPEAWPYGYDPAVSEIGNLLSSAVHVANKQIFDLASATPDYAGMGTTIVAMVERKGVLSVAHAGDSRAYLLSGDVLQQLTDDDSWIAAVLSKDPHADPASFKQHPMRHALTNVVGSRPRTIVHLAERQIKAGERLLLTTDGIHGVLDHQQLIALVKGGDAEHVASGLIAAALDGGSRDNCTAIVAEYSPDAN